MPPRKKQIWETLQNLSSMLRICYDQICSFTSDIIVSIMSRIASIRYISTKSIDWYMINYGRRHFSSSRISKTKLTETNDRHIKCWFNLQCVPVVISVLIDASWLDLWVNAQYNMNNTILEKFKSKKTKYIQVIFDISCSNSHYNVCQWWDLSHLMYLD
jgi:hypothetical protein